MQAEQRARAELLKELTALRKCVSELERTEQTLQESEEKWRSLAENAPNFIIITDANGRIQFINRTAPGCSVEEALGKTVYHFLEPAYHSLARTAIEKVFRTGEQSKYEARVTVPGGNTYLYETHVGPIKRDGKVTAATLISTDISARKKAEEALRQSEETVCAFFDAIPDTAVLMDSKANILAINRAGADRLGRSVDEIVGKNSQDIFPAEVFEVRQSKAAEVVRTGKMVRYEDERAGLYFDTCICPVFDAQGTVERLAAFARDITEHKKAEEATRQSEKKWRLLAETVPDVILTVEPNGAILFLNRSVPPFTPDSAVGTSVYDYVPPKYQQTLRNAIERVVRTGKPYGYELAGAGPNGRTSWYRSRLGPIKQGTKVVALTLVATDVTEYKETEDALRCREVLLTNIVSNVPHSIFWKDKNSVYLGCNDNFAKAAGIKNPADVIGKTDYDLPWKKREADSYRKFDKEIVSKGLPILNIEEPVRQADGKEAIVLTSKVALRNVDGEVIGILGIFTDITERKKAEDKIRQIKEGYDRLTNNADEAIFRVKAETNQVIYLNPAAERIFGYSQAEWLADPDLAFKMIHPDYKGRMEQILEEITKTRKPIKNAVLGWIAKDGRQVIMEHTAIPITDEDGQVVYFESIGRDITERDRIARALAESEGRYRALYESSMDGIASCDMEGNFTGANQAYLDMLGYTLEELKKLTYQQVTPAKWHETYEEVVKSQIDARGYSDEYEKEHIKKDGTVIPVSMRGWLIRDETEEPTGMWLIVRDITQRKRQEEALRESEENFRAIFDNATDGILVADPLSTQYITGNRMIRQMLGYNLEEIPNLKVRDIHPEESLTEDLRRFQKVLNREITLSEDVPIKRKDGSIFYADINTAFLRFGGKECLMGIFRDITEHKQAQRRLDRYREEVAQAERLASLGTLSATLAHELTQPLTVVRLSIENSLADLTTASCPASATEGLKDSLAEISHTVSIIDRLRNFARKSSKEDVSEVDLKAVADRIVMLLNASAQRARVTIRLKDLDKLPPVFVNEKDMEQLFFALVENAIHAAEGRKNRRLTISAATKGQHVKLQFSDNCGGIAPADIDKIFEPFFTTKSAGMGTGLGLCIVQRIVSHAGGKIRVESKTGKGSTFFITLPIKRAEGT